MMDQAEYVITTQEAGTQEEALQVALNRHREEYGYSCDARPGNYLRYDKNKPFSPRIAEMMGWDMDAHGVHTTAVVPMCSADDVKSATNTHTVIIKDENILSKVMNEGNIAKKMELLGIKAPQGRTPASFRIANKEVLSSKIIRETTSGKVVKRFILIPVEQVRVARFNNELKKTYKSQSEAVAAFEAMAGKYGPGVTVAVQSINVREDGDPNLVVCKYVATKTKVEVEVTFDSVKAGAKTTSWNVVFPYHS